MLSNNCEREREGGREREREGGRERERKIKEGGGGPGGSVPGNPQILSIGGVQGSGKLDSSLELSDSGPGFFHHQRDKIRSAG